LKKLSFSLLLLLALTSCAQVTNNGETNNAENIQLKDEQVAYFASGCFWCVEAIFESVKGVREAVSGYAGGEIEDPTYSQISSGKTRHAETVKVYYDSSVVHFTTLLDVFFNSHDPSTLNQQGPDSGPQYRSIAFYTNENELQAIRNKISMLKKEKRFAKITTEVSPIRSFYKAEEYHQNYERNHPENSYVQNVSIPRLNAFKKRMPEVLK
jgi:peptide-methionine (S)-S-oxide reductase